MKLKYLTIFTMSALVLLCHTQVAYSDNVLVTNGDTHAVPVKIMAGGTGGAGDASASNQTAEITKLTSLDGKIPASPATSGNQTTANTSLASIATNTANIPANGAATSANSLPVIQATATTVVSTALEASHILKASAGSLVSLHWLNTKTSSQYLLILNSATVTADGAVTLLYPPIYMPATSNGSVTFPTPLTASTGISVSNSSTGTFTKTIGSADCVFTGQVQ